MARGIELAVNSQNQLTTVIPKEEILNREELLLIWKKQVGELLL